MANQNERLKKIGGWFGDITNLVALLAIAIVVYELFIGKKERDTAVLLIALGTLILIVILRYADVGRFIEAVSLPDGVPPLGLARGSVRAFLAFGISIGFGLYIYYVTTHAAKNNELESQIFTALTAIISAVVGFYFGSRSTAAAQPAVRPAAPTVSSIGPSTGEAGKTDFETTVIGAGFQAGATVSLALGTDDRRAKTIDIVDATKIVCTLDLPSEKGDWNVVVTNPDGQSGMLAEGFEIKPAKVNVPGDTPVPEELTDGEQGEDE